MRYETISNIKKSRGSGHILLCTQIIQAGVDLDFDIGWGDFFSFISLIQTAGRVGRNGGGTTKEFNCFMFETPKGFTRDILCNYALEALGSKYPSGWEGGLAKLISRRLETKFRLEREYFDEWDGEREESCLREMNERVERQLEKLPTEILPLTLAPSPPYLGLNLRSWATLANLYGEEKFDELIILPSNINPDKAFKKSQQDLKYGLSLKQNYTIRSPKEHIEMLTNEGFEDTGIVLSDLPVWKKIENII
jgi:CRISPR/Cas system-associated endonuclease/helicase Cas3